MALHPASLEEGERVTIYKDRFLRGKVLGHNELGHVVILINDRRFVYAYPGEGVDWIRGWVHSGSPEAHALLTARALSTPLEPFRQTFNRWRSTPNALSRRNSGP